MYSVHTFLQLSDHQQSGFSPLCAARCSALRQSHHSRSPEWTEKCLAKEEINQLIKLRSLNQGTSNSLPIAASQAQCNITVLWKS